MTTREFIVAVLIAGIGVFAATSHAQDYAREKRWADEITPAILVGDPLYLELTEGAGKGHKFLTIKAEGRDKRVGIVLVHGVGVHPDHSVIGALRTRLNDLGYTTLSVQMPVARSEGSSVDDYYPGLFTQAGERIAAAARHLRAQGIERVVLASHSMGAWMSNCYLIDTPDQPFAAWVSISLTGRFWGASLIRVPFLGIEWLPGKIRLPVLDVFGEKDLAPTRDGAALRARALGHIPGSEQTVIAGADHFYAGREAALTQAIDGFIKKTIR